MLVGIWGVVWGLFGVFNQDYLIFKKRPSFRLFSTQQVVIYPWAGTAGMARPNSWSSHLTPAMISGVQLAFAAHSLSGHGEEEQSTLLTSGWLWMARLKGNLQTV